MSRKQEYFPLFHSTNLDLSNIPVLTKEKEVNLARLIRRKKIEKLSLLLSIPEFQISFYRKIFKNPSCFDEQISDSDYTELFQKVFWYVFRGQFVRASILLHNQVIKTECYSSILKDLNIHYGDVLTNSKIKELDTIEKDLIVNRDIFINSNIKLVLSIALKYSSYPNISFYDLIQEGCLGLIKAIDRFNYKLGYKFSTYATWYIKQSITSILNNQNNDIKVPVHALLAVSKLTLLIKKFLQDDDDILSELSKLPLNQVKNALIVKNIFSLDTEVKGVKQSAIINNFGNQTDMKLSFDEIITDKTLSEVINQHLKKLTPREEKIVRLRFGIDCR